MEFIILIGIVIGLCVVTGNQESKVDKLAAKGDIARTVESSFTLLLLRIVFLHVVLAVGVVILR